MAWSCETDLLCEYDLKNTVYLINDTQFLLRQGRQHGKFYVYDISTNEWTPFEHLANCSDPYQFDQMTQSLYIYDSYIKRVDFATKEQQAMLSKIEKPFKVPSNCAMLKIGDSHHIIGGYGHSHHEVWNEQPDERGKILHSFPDPFPCQLARAIHLSDTNDILYFGGIHSSVCYDTIYQFSCQQQAWHCLDLKMPIPLEGFGCVLTSDQRHVIVCGGYSAAQGVGRETLDDIYVLDLPAKVWWQSSIKCPKAELYNAILVGLARDQPMLVFAWLRLKCNEVVLPLDIVKVIATMVGRDDQRVHLFCRGSIKHYTISVKEIFSNLLPIQSK